MLKPELIERVVKKELDNNFVSNGRKIANLVKNLFLGSITASTINTISGFLERSFLKGSKRVLSLDGEVLKEVPPGDLGAVFNQARAQRSYLENLSDEQEKLVFDEINKALDQGLSSQEAARNIRKQVEGMTKSRAERISRSEIIKASSEGTKRAMESAGIKRVIWLATIDSRTCQTCKALHESVWDIEKTPMPVKDSHPNCRCTLVADTRDL